MLGRACFSVSLFLCISVCLFECVCVYVCVAWLDVDGFSRYACYQFFCCACSSICFCHMFFVAALLLLLFWLFKWWLGSSVIQFFNLTPLCFALANLNILFFFNSSPPHFFYSFHILQTFFVCLSIIPLALHSIFDICFITELLVFVWKKRPYDVCRNSVVTVHRWW